MTNTINNVPRDLLERCLISDRGRPNERLNEELSALLSATSPAGVDGLEVVVVVEQRDIFPTSHWSRPRPHLMWASGMTGDKQKKIPHGTELSATADAQRIIDGLRGEVERLKSESFEDLYNAAIDERDQQALRADVAVADANDAERKVIQQAQRVGELDLLLQLAEHVLCEYSFNSLGDVIATTQADRDDVREKIVATLDAGKEVLSASMDLGSTGRMAALEAALRMVSSRGLSPILTEAELESIDALLSDGGAA